MLIPKYAKLVVTKRFDGAAAAIEAVKSGSFYIGVDEAQDNTSGSFREQYQLNLQPWSPDNPTGYRYIDAGGQYVWVLDELLPLKSYWVAEHKYTASSPYTTAKRFQLYNSTQSTLTGTGYRVQVEHVYPYADDVWVDAIQTVAFTNRYTSPRELSLIKLDGVTGNPLSDVPFRFVLYPVQEDGSTPEVSMDFVTGPNGRITLEFPQTLEWNGQQISIRSWQEGVFDGRHRFSITESPHPGYQALQGPITGYVTLYDDKGCTLTLDESSNPLLLVEDQGGGSILYVANRPETMQVQVSKHWQGGASRAVNMQLLRNGVPVLGKNITLGADAALVSADGAHNTDQWSYTWTGLPAYVDGTKADYTVREEWIGVPGGTDSIHYNTAADADGYADYIVSMTRSGEGDISVHVENTPDGGQVVFSKVDDLQQAVPGAEFTVYRDEACTIPISASDFRDGTDKEKPAVFVSDANGMVTIPVLKEGTYALRETKAPLGWTLKDARTFTLTFSPQGGSLTGIDPDNGQSETVTQVVNQVYAVPITIRKTVSGTDSPLSGAVFSLHASGADGSMVSTPIPGSERYVTGDDGLVSLGRLRRGVYYLVEEQAPAGYQRLKEPIRVTIPDSGASPVTAIKAVSNTGLSVTDEGVITVGNSAGVTLPATGGSGELMEQFGTLLLLAAGALWLLCLLPRRGKAGDRPR